MNIDSSDLLPALDQIIGLCARRTTLPILNSIHIESRGTSLELTSTDLDAHASVLVPCEADIESLCVNGNLFHALVKSAGETITITGENARLVVEAKGRASLAALPGKDFPPFPASGSPAIGVPVLDLALAIESVAWAADKDNLMNPFYRCVWVKCADKSIRSIGTSGIKFCQFQRDLLTADCEFIFPCHHAALLCEALRKENSTLHLTETHVIVKSPLFTVAIKKAEGEYPNLDPFLIQKRDDLGDINPKPIIDALDTCHLLSTCRDWPAVNLKGFGKELVVELEDPVNEYSASIERWSCSETFRLNGTLFREVLQHCEGITSGSYNANSLMFECGDLTLAVGRLMPLVKK